MSNWKSFCEKWCQPGTDVEKMKDAARRDPSLGIAPDSLQQIEGVTLFIARDGDQKALIVYPGSGISDRFNGDDVTLEGETARVCPLNLANCRVLREIFPFTRPVSHRGRAITFGLGDRLGLAGCGQLRAIKKTNAFPVLAQQSMRELNLTARTFDDVLAAASWAVFQEGYEDGFGADGDHLKTEQEVKALLDCGVTMITLDCSEQIHNEVPGLSSEAVAKRYAQLPEEERNELEAKWLKNPTFMIGQTRLNYEPEMFWRMVLVYRDAIRHAVKIYQDQITPCKRPIDFELSIDETETPTSPEAHYFVAQSLVDQDVTLTTLAPRFCGAFEKGIDYRGDLEQFTREFESHVAIARHFDYKISVHSGSDKFKIFPIVGEKTGGVFHLKTAGTSWLEAVRVIAEKDPGLYRKMHLYALEHLEEARQYYHISADPDRIAPLNTVSDEELPDLMDEDDARQLMHITYGLLLKARLPDHSERFKPGIYALLDKEEEAYSRTLERHIGRHLETLGVPVTHAE